MRRISFALLGTLLTASPAMAETSRPFWGTADKLLFASDTFFAGETGVHTLCVQVTDTYKFFIVTDRVATNYAFSQTKCTTPDVIPVRLDRMPVLKDAGILPASVPDTPTAPPIASYLLTLGIGFAIALLAGIGWLVRRPMRKASRRVNARSGETLFFDVLQTVMFQTARTDGVIEKTELQSIMTVYQDITGTPLTPDMAAAKFAAPMSQEAVINLAKPYRDDQARLLMDAAVRVATHNGIMTREKKTLLTNLGQSLNQDIAELRTTIATRLETQKHHQTQLELT